MTFRTRFLNFPFIICKIVNYMLKYLNYVSQQTQPQS